MFRRLKEFLFGDAKGKPVTWVEEDIGNYNVRVTATYKDGSISKVIYEGLPPEAGERIEQRNREDAERAIQRKAEQKKMAAK